MLDALLGAAGYRVGAYTSPHLLRYNERIAVAGVPASDEQIIAAFERVEAVRDDLPLTYFEYGTLAAMVVFSSAGLDVWVLEIGLGGRLDACNAVEPTASLITNIALDHCDWLGHDVETIAVEKAGVMRRGVADRFRIARRAALPDRSRRENRGRDSRCSGAILTTRPTATGRWNWTGQGVSLTGLALARPAR